MKFIINNFTDEIGKFLDKTWRGHLNRPFRSGKHDFFVKNYPLSQRLASGILRDHIKICTPYNSFTEAVQTYLKSINNKQ